MNARSLTLLALLGSALPLVTACAAASLAPQLEPLPVAQAADAELDRNVFQRDRMGALSEDDLRAVLRAPVYLEAKARLGIVPVASRYHVDDDVPLNTVPGALASALGDSGEFEVVSEVSTDWPSTSSIAGLRELAARYRAEYLLLYRHRFVDRTTTNAWALGWITVVGAFFLPHNTVEVAGVAEATLFDVKTGTLLFTVFERVSERSDSNIWQNDRKRRDTKERLLDDATQRLAEATLTQISRLVAARPAPAPAVVRPTAPEPGDLIAPRDPLETVEPAGPIAPSEPIATATEPDA